MAAARRKVDFDALEREGSIVRRNAYFYRSASRFVLNSAELGEMTKRVKARVPRGSGINVIDSEAATYLVGDGWRSKLVKTGEGDGRSSFEYWFADMKWSVKKWPLAQMNIAITAVETAFLLADPYTLVDSRFASSKAREFDIAEDLTNVSVFDSIEIGKDLAEFVEVPIGVGLPMRAIELGSTVGRNILDGVLTRFVNDAAANPGNHIEFLLQHYIGSPALPPKLRQVSHDFVARLSDAGACVSPEDDDAAKPEQDLPRATEQELPQAAERHQDASPDAQSCPTCGQANELGARFCAKCGTPLVPLD